MNKAHGGVPICCCAAVAPAAAYRHDVVAKFKRRNDAFALWAALARSAIRRQR
ncbi:MAG: hypothetical protein JWR16_1913 [Nevskia sp.]|nr:hypothetical protein [Nevskia sp.]